jgi:hypothetical protein
MSSEAWIFSGGIYHLAFVIFHLFFWKLFRWHEELVKISFINRSVMQILNISLTFMFFIFAYLSLFHTVELLVTSVGISLLLLISIFWLLRALQQILFFGIRSGISVFLTLVFFLGFVIYLIPFLRVIP